METRKESEVPNLRDAEGDAEEKLARHEAEQKDTLNQAQTVGLPPSIDARDRLLMEIDGRISNTVSRLSRLEALRSRVRWYGPDVAQIALDWFSEGQTRDWY